MSKLIDKLKMVEISSGPGMGFRTAAMTKGPSLLLIPRLSGLDAKSGAAVVEGGADAVMIGRAALANPWVFAQIYDLASGRSPRVVRPEHRTAALATFHRFLAETLPEKALLGRLKGMACRLSRGRAKSAAARRRIGEAGDAAAVLALFADLMESSLAETEAVELVAQNRPAPGATP